MEGPLETSLIILHFEILNWSDKQTNRVEKSHKIKPLGNTQHISAVWPGLTYVPSPILEMHVEWRSGSHRQPFCPRKRSIARH